MKDSVLIKSNKYGITIRSNPEAPFEMLLMETEEKFRSAENFFNHADMVVELEGRTFTEEETARIVETIQAAAKIRILCLIEKDGEKEKKYRQLQKKCLETVHEKDGLFYKGTLRERHRLEAETSIVIIGDVEDGAIVTSKGNVVVIGTIRGCVTAGASGCRSAWIAALHINSKRLRIGEIEVKPVIGGSYSWAKLL